MLIRPRRAVSIGNIDVSLGKGLTNPGQLALLIEDFQNDDVLFHHIELFFFQKEQRLGGIIHQKPDHRTINGIVNREREDINPSVRENAANARKIPGPVLQKNGELLLDPVHKRLNRHPADNFLSQGDGRFWNGDADSF